MAAKKNNKIKASVGSRVFDLVNLLVLLTVASACLVPFLFVIAASVSPLSDILMRKFFIYPIHLDFSTYKYLFSSVSLIKSMGVSGFVTLVGTVLSMVLTLMTAYALSKDHLKGRGFFNALIVFTMMFSGGMIPTYLVVNGLKMTDTLWALWLPGCISAYNTILIRSSISALPKELEEAAVVDGCNYFQSFRRIVLPLIKPAVATFSLFYAVGYWNDYFDAVLYVNNSELWPIQVWLRQIVLLSSGGFSDASAVSDIGYIPPQNVSYAVIVFATLPILLVYPFVQKCFSKGMMLGSVKG